VINGIRDDVSEIREDMGVVRALREDNGKRLEHIETDLKTMNHRMKSCSISSTRGCNPMTIRR